MKLTAIQTVLLAVIALAIVTFTLTHLPTHTDASLQAEQALADIK